ncbi:hypothetical protein I302_106395 [Kwoniella bestiolae CBS 10118]|uniref:Major facilitator superfamily (MFS) profile domain-containing protein n=1 Tax=Kwoniella bestiolae CBS 10118 TaxID=1296100 RepID=A0AAJ8KAM0_9TREE
MGFLGQDWSQATGYLIFCVAVFSMGDFIFGLDVSAFGGLQALPSFLNDFGVYNEATKKMALPTLRKSLMNSIVYIGRITGVIAFEPVTEKWGFRTLFIAICIVQLLSVILQLAAKEWIQFTIGRVFGYVTIGTIEAAIPMYCAEIAPAHLRGFLSGTFVPIQTSASIMGSGVVRAMATETQTRGWLIPISIQLIPAVIGLAGVAFTVESPRWLISKGRHEEAVNVLSKLRTKEDVANGLPEAEVQALVHAVEVDRTIGSGTWLELFSGPVWRRTLYAAIIFFANEAGGNQFWNSYGPSFMVDAGLGAKSFTYSIIVSLAGAIGGLIGILSSDTIGRRPPAIFGSALLVVWDCLIAGLGSRPDITSNAIAQNVVVASFVLLIWSTKIAYASVGFIVCSEMGGIRMRKKIMMVGTANDVIWSFVVAFSTPYVMQKIGANVGYVFAAIAFIGLVFAIFFLPELKGRSLEEMDELFDNPRFKWGWQYPKVQTTGAGAAVAQVENANRAHHLENDDSKLDNEKREANIRVQEATWGNEDMRSPTTTKIHHLG